MAGKTNALKGFSDKVLFDPSTRYDFEKAIPIEDIDYEKIPVFTYWGNKELPPLPIGFYLKSKDDNTVERLTTYTFHADKLNAASAELFLEKQEEKTRDAKGAIQKLAGFLAKVVDTIGGYPLQEIVERYGNSAEFLFKKAWVADVFTMYLGARLITIGDEIAVSGLQCNCNRRSVIYDDPANDRPLHSLNEVEIKYFSGFDQSLEPIFKVSLPKGFNDGKGEVKNIYVNPMRLEDITAIADGKGQDTTKHKTLQRMICGIPESEIFGLKRGNVFNEDVFKLLDRKDRRCLERIIADIQPGPVNNIKVRCHNCLEAPEVSYTLPWMQQTSFFLFASDEPDIPEDN